MKDDWFKDTYNYKDFLKPDVLLEYFDKNIVQHNGIYIPSEKLLLNIPKKNFSIRYALETNIYDRFLYQGYLNELAPYYDPLLSERVYSHRYQTNESKRKNYIFKHPIEQWSKFIGYVRDGLQSSEKVLLETDIQNYFENIRIEDLSKTLQENLKNIQATGIEKIRLRHVIDSLINSLHLWSFNHKNGLPQNRDTSSFLANMVMNVVDKKMIEGHGYDYHRYMDDIRIVCNDKYEARKALKQLIIELRKIGLNINSAKTKIIDTDHEEYSSLFEDDLDIKRLDNMFRSRSLPVIMRSFIPLKGYALRQIAEGNTQERGFRFSINRLTTLAMCSDVNKPDGYFDEITDAVITELVEQPFSSDKFMDYLKSVELQDSHIERIKALLLNTDQSIYGWQNYLLWQLLVYKNITDDHLLQQAGQKLSSVSIIAPSDVAGSALYLGAQGREAEKNIVADNFQNFNNFFTQRNALIALHELNYRDIKEKIVNVDPAVIGTLTRVKCEFNGKYFQEKTPISWKKIYDEGTSYE
ncbi:RNA-directed DNA polymerase [Candidatus Marinarcus aquaticus]|nr:RNA-directed DNA polymerase [Candidatus Marinarcus aquaticus]